MSEFKKLTDSITLANRGRGSRISMMRDENMYVYFRIKDSFGEQIEILKFKWTDRAKASLIYEFAMKLIRDYEISEMVEVDGGIEV